VSSSLTRVESVWDYPRPPALEPATKRVRVEHGGETIADSERALRLLETSQPPAYYIPPEDVRLDLLTQHERRTGCEWKGQARYWTVNGSQAAAWSYAQPAGRYAALRDHIAFYPQKVDGCFVGEERVEPNAGDFYGGWITSDIKGPFKGGPGTAGW
jgi:uncharacterized protein (DUF427 family)